MTDDLAARLSSLARSLDNLRDEVRIDISRLEGRIDQQAADSARRSEAQADMRAELVAIKKDIGLLLAASRWLLGVLAALSAAALTHAASVLIQVPRVGP